MTRGGRARKEAKRPTGVRLDFSAPARYVVLMATPVLEDVQFPLAHCLGCARDVIAYVELGEGGHEVRRCLQCDQRLTEWHEAGADELEAAGYSLLEARSCGNGGGCGASCGMRR